MKIVWSWLREYLLGDYTLDQVVTALTNLGLEVESLEDEGHRLKDFIVGHITATRRHPDADRLQICTIETGANIIELVCGGVNARANLKVALALPGVVIPSTGQPLKSGKVRGIDSPGMLCSLDELLLSSTRFGKSEGILELPHDAVVGEPIANALGLNDAIIDLSVTPNRSDCFAAYGIARDLFAYFSMMGHDVRLRPLPEVLVATMPEMTTPLFERTLPASCYAFSLLKIANIQSTAHRNNAVYEKITHVLEALSLNRITPLVDVTNYMCVVFGRPMHVFDADKIQGKISLRPAHDGEIFEGLDDKTYTLSNNMLVICDEGGIISLAGIMGGKRTACDEDTTNIFLESAWFDPISIATTGQKLNILSDARMRFERGVDPSLVKWGLSHAASLLQSMCGGVIESYDEASFQSVSKKAISLTYKDVERVIGQSIASEDIAKSLELLGCTLNEKTAEHILVTPPSWRHDLEKSIDLIEEVVRLRGVEHITETPLPTLTMPTYTSPSDTKKRLCASILVARGYTETLHFSFLDEKTAHIFEENHNHLLPLDNPITQDLTTMRPSLLPSLLKAVADNQKRSLPTVALFEIAPVYGKHLVDFQNNMCGGVWAGKNHTRHWQNDNRDISFFDAKEHVLEILHLFGMNISALQQNVEGAPTYYHPYQSMALCQGPRVIAYVGLIHPKILKNMDVTGPVAAFEIMMDVIPDLKAPKTNTAPLSPFQSVERDFAFQLPIDFPVGTLHTVLCQKLTRQKTFPKDVTLQHVSVFDVFEKKELNQKSVAVSLRLQPETSTLSEQDLESIHATVTTLVENETGGILRQH